MTRKAYPSDVSDDEWASVALYLTLMREDAGQLCQDTIHVVMESIHEEGLTVGHRDAATVRLSAT